MDQTTLVREQIDGGQRLLERLRAGGFPLLGACWARMEEESKPYLYIIAPGVEESGTRSGYHAIGLALQQLETEGKHPLERLDPFAIRLIGPRHPIADGVLGLYQKFPGQAPTWHMGSVLGRITIGGAYIYPPTMFAQSPPAAPQPA